MSKILDLLRTTIRREREWAETRVDAGDSTLVDPEEAAQGIPLPGAADGDAAHRVDDATMPGRPK